VEASVNATGKDSLPARRLRPTGVRNYGSRKPPSHAPAASLRRDPLIYRSQYRIATPGWLPRDVFWLPPPDTSKVPLKIPIRPIKVIGKPHLVNIKDVNTKIKIIRWINHHLIFPPIIPLPILPKRALKDDNALTRATRSRLYYMTFI